MPLPPSVLREFLAPNRDQPAMSAVPVRIKGLSAAANHSRKELYNQSLESKL
jgi:hypothetical protein